MASTPDTGARMQLQALTHWLASVQVTGASMVVLTNAKGVPTVALDNSWTVGPPVKITTTIYVAIATQMQPLLPADFTQRVIAARDT